MKFIVHNLRMIRARLRSNGWVLAELFGVYRDVVSLRFAGMPEVYVLSPVGVQHRPCVPAFNDYGR